ncbi:hypothetical protein HDU83_000432 [Entophlyctis luteolus]|nr:hypothetical protein HDU83_000432 [Entophlyctis luteolus]
MLWSLLLWLLLSAACYVAVRAVRWAPDSPLLRPYDDFVDLLRADLRLALETAQSLRVRLRDALNSARHAAASRYSPRNSSFASNAAGMPQPPVSAGSSNYEYLLDTTALENGAYAEFDEFGEFDDDVSPALGTGINDDDDDDDATVISLGPGKTRSTHAHATSGVAFQHQQQQHELLFFKDDPSQSAPVATDDAFGAESSTTRLGADILVDIA